MFKLARSIPAVLAYLPPCDCGKSIGAKLNPLQFGDTMLQWVLKWRYVLFIVVIGLATALKSGDTGEYAWTHYTADAILFIALVAWTASILMRPR
jgi:hypothetical protein